jgi:amino acid adenylation domain-containing protein
MTDAVVAGLLAHRAAGQPAAVAVEHGDCQVSYGELVAGVRDAGAAVAQVAARGEVVAVDGRPGPGLVMAAAGVMATGRVLLLLDPELPPARRETLLRESRAAAIATVCEGDVTSVARHGPQAQRLVNLADDAAYVFFTSGTTGTPRAIVGRSTALAHFLRWEAQHVGLGRGDRVAMLTALGFDVVLRDIFGPLVAGATLVIPETQLLDSADVPVWLDDRRISLVHAVPTLAASWLAAMDRPAAHSPRVVLFAGEPLTGALVNRWRTRFPGTQRIVNLYGPTETTLAKCAFDVPDPPLPGIQPLGTPLPGTCVFVIGDDGRPVPDGESGQLAIETVHRSAGYLNSPEETRRRFVDLPDGASGQVVFLTGDRGHWSTDGLLQIEGRLDDQVKIRGVRVEPAEVTAVLQAHPAVADAAVLVVGPGSVDAVLAAFLVLERGHDIQPAALRAHVAGLLPATFVPATVRVIDRLPTTPNGKVDRERLRAWSAEVATPAASPRTDTEQQLEGIWCEVLGLAGVRDDDDFFVLGGHSLTAARMLSRIRQDLGLELPLSALFDAPTFRGFAAAVSQHEVL